MFWSITASLTIRFDPKEKSTQTLSLLTTVTELAMVLELQLERLISQYLGWPYYLWHYWHYRVGEYAAVAPAAAFAEQQFRLFEQVPELFYRPALVSIHGITVAVTALLYRL